MSEIRLGTYQNPYTKSKYTEMKENNIWTGGWVQEYKADYDIPTYVTYYISRSGISYIHEEDQEPYGTQNNAFPENVYNEMCQKDLWPGGYVDIENDGLLPVYCDPDDGTQTASGCGCGSGSGDESDNESGDGNDNEGGNSGSGCSGGPFAVASGTLIRVLRWFDIEIDWDAGVLNGEPGSEPEFTRITVKNNYQSEISYWGHEIKWEGANLKVKISYKENGSTDIKTIEGSYSVAEYIG